MPATALSRKTWVRASARSRPAHIRNQFTIPVGVRAALDTAVRTLTLLEPAVS
jgi:muramoyltetrapeptide carboxypeptidase LdcA involved in peptidoglycan recycling